MKKDQVGEFENARMQNLRNMYGCTVTRIKPHSRNEDHKFSHKEGIVNIQLETLSFSMRKSLIIARRSCLLVALHK